MKYKKTVKIAKKTLFWHQNSRNHIIQQKTMEPYELGQKLQITSHRGHQVQ